MEEGRKLKESGEEGNEEGRRGAGKLPFLLAFLPPW